MTDQITITITAEERDELLNALYFYTGSPNIKLTDQELGLATHLLNMLEITDEDVGNEPQPESDKAWVSAKFVVPKPSNSHE
jgi:hypothetical protein